MNRMMCIINEFIDKLFKTKVVQIKCAILVSEQQHDFPPVHQIHNRWKEFDDHLFEKYGLKCIEGNRYKLKDESKFTLFLLKYSNYIRGISHE